ncbi:hypothetical protein HUW86_09525 [Fusobacterium sp. SB021]|uniref:hypothetical protein n=1 Tax=Fusobacterium sp. SB021 TaxID=2744227 RepID=UPI003CE9B424
MAADIDIFGDMTAALKKNTYQSTFDFESYEINEHDKNFIIKREEIIAENFKTYSKSLFEVCRALYEISITMKAEGSFMAWYTHNGLTKDKVSELLKRYELYIMAPGMEDYVTRLPIISVKALTNKNMPEEQLMYALENQISNSEEIKLLMFKNAEDNKKVIPFNNKFSFKVYTDFEKRIKKAESIRDLATVKTEISDLKKSLAELEKTILEKEKQEENKNNLKLPEELFPAYKNLESGFIHTIEKEKDKYTIGIYTNLENYKSRNKKYFLSEVTGINSFEEAEGIFNNIVMFQKVKKIE